MERPIQTVERLIGSLEILASQESIHLADEAWLEVAAVQERSAALIDRLTTLMADSKVRFGLSPDVYARARAIAASQGIKIAQLGVWMAHTDSELQSLIAAQQRARSVRPVYRNRLENGGGGSFDRQA